MKHRTLYHWWIATLTVIFCAPAAASSPAQSLLIPEKPAGAPERRVTVNDMSALRRIDSLRLSPDLRRFAMLVRQADVSANDYRLGWFVGSVRDGRLIPVGDGGEARLAVGVSQSYNGFEHPAVRWSANGRWIAYTVARGGEIQLWRSRTDGGAQEQITHHAADVRDFEWSKDGKSLYFTAGAPREELRAREEAKERNGYHYDTDLRGFVDLMGLRAPPPEKEVANWIVTLADGRERGASESELSDFKQAQSLSGAAFQRTDPQRTGAFAERADGARAQARIQPNGERPGLVSRMQVALPGSSDPIQCAAAECSGLINRVWWGDENTILFLRQEGIGNAATGLYAWTPANGAVSMVVRTLDDFLRECELATGMRLVCVRETPTLPAHVAAIDHRTGAMQTIADVNPEFGSIALGSVERFEWATPKFQWNAPGAPLHGVYPERAYGYILYPPQFDPAQKYPVFMSPYAAVGFDNIVNQEYALHVLAANGFVVLNTNVPSPGAADSAARRGADSGKLLYSAELGFPHLSMYMESTVRALDTVVSRGFVDSRRVGVGGVSAGASVPLYMMQQHDRIAAVSIAGGAWSQLEYYVFTPRGRSNAQTVGGTWFVKPVGPGLDFWKQIDLADNVETIEAPILINTPATETYSLIRLMKHMAEAGKPYDAYVFPKETHIKWQAAHLHAAMQRNLDWFRFWLQSYEDPDAGKSEQYSRWRKLRELQIKQQPSAAAAFAPNRGGRR